jgi:hypothetical protein
MHSRIFCPHRLNGFRKEKIDFAKNIPDMAYEQFKQFKGFYLDDLETIPNELEEFVRRDQKNWVIPTRILMNMEYYDSRTIEWKSLVIALCSSTLGGAMAILHIYPQCPPNPSDFTPDNLNRDWECDTNTKEIIVNSPLCVKVEYKGFLAFAARMKPLSEALPFVLDVMTNPPGNSTDSRIAKGYYVRSMALRFKDFQVRVHIYREGQQGDPSR